MTDFLTDLPTDYPGRVARLTVTRDAATARWNQLANVRLLAAGVAVAFAIVALWRGSGWPILPALLAAAAFFWLVRRHRRAGRERAWANALLEINREGEARERRDWDALPLRHTIRADASHPYANDLDLFGPASLMLLLQTFETSFGETTLADWLLAPSSTPELERRQAAVSELAPELRWRQRLAAHGRLIGEPKPDPEPFLNWAEQTPLLAGRSWLPWVARLGAVGFVLLVVADLFGVTGAPLWLGAALFNVLVVQALGGQSRDRIRILADQHQAIERYTDLLGEIERMPGAAPLLADARQSLVTADGSATHELDRLRRISTWVVPPSSIVYLLLQAAVAWDVHLLDALERWQRDAGHAVRGWLRVVGDVEAVSSLATLAGDNPSWVLPRIEPAADDIRSRSLAHPLLGRDRVANDVVVGPPGRFLLVTGSNMSGKSTLLRTIGINLVLAQAGGPVCASDFHAPPCRLWTSVHVEDSLAAGVSFFMAELRRLRAVVEAAEQPDPDGRPLVYLLDEILQGTNTAERQIAARRVIRALIDSGAIGSVSTHDLTLAEGPELVEVAVSVHFREQVEEIDGSPTMTFDYTLRQGIATSTNALKLMEIVFEGRGHIATAARVTAFGDQL